MQRWLSVPKCSCISKTKEESTYSLSRSDHMTFPRWACRFFSVSSSLWIDCGHFLFSHMLSSVARSHSFHPCLPPLLFFLSSHLFWCPCQLFPSLNTSPVAQCSVSKPEPQTRAWLTQLWHTLYSQHFVDKLRLSDHNIQCCCFLVRLFPQNTQTTSRFSPWFSFISQWSAEDRLVKSTV